MAYTIANLKDDAVAMLHNKSINKFQNIYGAINRAARQLQSDADLFETERIAQITNAIYDRVYDYALPSDLKGNKIINITPQATSSKNTLAKNNQEFSIYRQNQTYNVQYNSGVKTIKLSMAGNVGVQTGQDGTWVASGDAENVSDDSLYKLSGSASIKFDLSGAGTSGAITNSTFTSSDLETHENVSALFMWLYIPDSSIMTSVELQWGTDSSNYWSRTVTAGHSEDFLDGWNLLRFDWNGATETGTPDSSDISHLKVTINYDGTADTDFRLDSIISKLGNIYDINYYSKYLFKSDAGAWKEEVDDDSDIVNLDTDSYNLLTYKVAEMLAMQQQGESSEFDVAYYTENYQRALAQYKRNYKSKFNKIVDIYYQ